jgi:hypothetical protein
LNHLSNGIGNTRYALLEIQSCLIDASTRRRFGAYELCLTVGRHLLIATFDRRTVLAKIADKWILNALSGSECTLRLALITECQSTMDENVIGYRIDPVNHLIDMCIIATQATTLTPFL